jgi:hypothetical protein
VGVPFRFVIFLLFGSALLPGSVVADSASAVTDSDCAITSISFAVNGAPAPLVAARRGDHVEVAFDVPSGCVDRLTFASWVAPEPAFDGSKLDEQALYSKASGLFGAGRHSTAVDVYDFPGDTIADCGSAPAPARVVSQLPDRHAKVTDAGGANQSGPYDSTCDGSPSENGNGNGNARGKPCAGCVGNADDKNPPGQLPGGNDHNAGYECDRNEGIGNGNPAHSGCKNFQLDLAYRPSPDDDTTLHEHPAELIAGVFRVRATGVTYTTDHTGTNAVAGS